MPYQKIKYANYEALFIHEAGNRTSGSYNGSMEAIKIFYNDPKKIILRLYKSTNNNTRLKLIDTYIKD